MNTKWFYRLTAWAYDLLDVIYFNNYERSPRKTVLGAINPDDTILDLCTGTGANAVRIGKSRPNVKIVGVDLSREMLTMARKKAKKNAVHNIKLYEMDATDMRFKDKCFDKISISLVLHELDDELTQKLILEAKRVLKDDGEIIITEWEPSKELWRRVLFAPIAMLEPKPYKTFVKKNLGKYFRQFGLEVTETKHCDYTKVLRVRKCD